MNPELDPFDDEPTDPPTVLEDGDEPSEEELHERRQARQSGGFDVPMFGLS